MALRVEVEALTRDRADVFVMTTDTISTLRTKAAAALNIQGGGELMLLHKNKRLEVERRTVAGSGIRKDDRILLAEVPAPFVPYSYSDDPRSWSGVIRTAALRQLQQGFVVPLFRNARRWVDCCILDGVLHPPMLSRLLAGDRTLASLDQYRVKKLTDTITGLKCIEGRRRAFQIIP